MNRPAAGTKASYHHGDLRGALLAAAEVELAERGVEGFTLRGCAKRAGVSHAAPAHHFRDADALLTALTAAGYARFTAALVTHGQAANGGPRERLVAIGTGYIAFALAEPALFRLMFSSSRPDFENAELQRTASKAFAVLVEAVGAVRGSGRPADQSAMCDVAAAWAVVHGLAELFLSGRLPFLEDPASPPGQVALRDIIARVLPPERTDKASGG